MREGFLKWRFVRQAFVGAAALALATSPLRAHGPWMVIKDCREIPNDSNDGDSFHLSVRGKEYIFRLYFADAPETEASFPERVEEQAKYFNLTTAQTLQLGGYAKRFVEEQLRQPFTVRSCLQGALGRSNQKRFYAFIETKDGDLAELLVANGMARVHGSAAIPVGLSSPEREWGKLQRLENAARQQKVGGWGAAVGRMTVRLAKQPSKTGLDSFDAFFHPEKQAIIAAEEERLGSRPALVPGGSKLDPNTATAAELEKVKGIGTKTASRIIASRPFKTADDLRKVKGIGAKKYKKFRPYFM